MNEESRAVNKNYSLESVLIVSFSAVALLVHLLTNGRYGYFRDELYYIACARQLFVSVEDLGQIVSSPWAMPFERRMHIFLCRDLKGSVQEFWPRVRKWL